MMGFEMANILFFIKSIKDPSEHFNILGFVQFIISFHQTQSTSGSNLKLKHCLSSNQIEILKKLLF